MRSRTVVFKRMATVLTASLLFICVLGTSLGAARVQTDILEHAVCDSRSLP